MEPDSRVAGFAIKTRRGPEPAQEPSDDGGCVKKERQNLVLGMQRVP